MLLSGTILGKYTVEGLIGGGGFGLVYRATQRGPAGFVQEVALKTVHPSAEDGLATLMREAQIIARLRHRPPTQATSAPAHC
jgi:serine/threonine protein kinase